MKRSDFYNVKETAGVLGYHPQTVRRMARDRDLIGIRRGRSWLFLKTDIDNILAKGLVDTEVKENLDEEFLD